MEKAANAAFSYDCMLKQQMEILMDKESSLPHRADCFYFLLFSSFIIPRM